MKPKKRTTKPSWRSKLLGALRSKTMWFSFLVISFGVINDNISYLQDHIGSKWYGYVVILIGIITGMLRWITTQPLDDKTND